MGRSCPRQPGQQYSYGGLHDHEQVAPRERANSVSLTWQLRVHRERDRAHPHTTGWRRARSAAARSPPEGPPKPPPDRPDSAQPSVRANSPRCPQRIVRVLHPGNGAPTPGHHRTPRLIRQLQIPQERPHRQAITGDVVHQHQQHRWSRRPEHPAGSRSSTPSRSNDHRRRQRRVQIATPTPSPRPNRIQHDLARSPSAPRTPSAAPHAPGHHESRLQHDEVTPRPPAAHRALYVAPPLQPSRTTTAAARTTAAPTSGRSHRSGARAGSVSRAGPAPRHNGDSNSDRRSTAAPPRADLADQPHGAGVAAQVKKLSSTPTCSTPSTSGDSAKLRSAAAALRRHAVTGGDHRDRKGRPVHLAVDRHRQVAETGRPRKAMYLLAAPRPRPPQPGGVHLGARSQAPHTPPAACPRGGPHAPVRPPGHLRLPSTAPRSRRVHPKPRQLDLVVGPADELHLAVGTPPHHVPVSTSARGAHRRGWPRPLRVSAAPPSTRARVAPATYTPRPHRPAPPGAAWSSTRPQCCPAAADRHRGPDPLLGPYRIRGRERRRLRRAVPLTTASGGTSRDPRTASGETTVAAGPPASRPERLRRLVASRRNNPAVATAR